jgi:hypothetical protein
MMWKEGLRDRKRDPMPGSTVSSLLQKSLSDGRDREGLMAGACFSGVFYLLMYGVSLCRFWHLSVLHCIVCKLLRVR